MRTIFLLPCFVSFLSLFPAFPHELPVEVLLMACCKYLIVHAIRLPLRQLSSVTKCDA
jgi:hypothetical protein